MKDRKNTQRKKQGKNKKEKEGSASCAQVVRRDTIRVAARDGKLYTHPYHARGMASRRWKEKNNNQRKEIQRQANK